MHQQVHLSIERGAPGTSIPRRGTASHVPVARSLRPARTAVVANTADIPSDLHQHAGHGTGSKCPFLAGLRTPPTVDIPWYKRVQLQVFNPANFQKTILEDRGSETMVQVAQQPLFNSFYMPATMQLAKDVFAAESDGTTTQGLGGNNIGFKGFATLLGEDSLLIVADGERHKQLRALLQPAFNADAIAAYLPGIQSLVQRHMAKWVAAGPEGVKAYEGNKMLTFDFILQVAMGRAIPDDELHRLSDLFNTLVRGLLAWPFLNIPSTPWNKALKAQKELISYFQAGVTAARQQLAAGDQAPAVMGRLVAAVDEDGNRLTDKEITDNMLLLLVAGHDTSSTTLTRCMSNLQDHPEVWQKLRDEQAAVVARHGDQLTAAALKEMTYADAVIRETLRLDPVVSGVVRITTRDYQLGGYAVPAGTRLSLPLRHLAANDPRWVNSQGDMAPSVFNPERMLTPSGAKPGQLMPFGGGVRYCLGAVLAMAEMKVYLAVLARQYDFSVDNNTEWKPALGYYPANGLPMVITLRQ